MAIISEIVDKIHYTILADYRTSLLTSRSDQLSRVESAAV